MTFARADVAARAPTTARWGVRSPYHLEVSNVGEGTPPPGQSFQFASITFWVSSVDVDLTQFIAQQFHCVFSSRTVGVVEVRILVAILVRVGGRS